MSGWRLRLQQAKETVRDSARKVAEQIKSATTVPDTTMVLRSVEAVLEQARNREPSHRTESSAQVSFRFEGYDRAAKREVSIPILYSTNYDGQGHRAYHITLDHNPQATGWYHLNDVRPLLREYEGQAPSSSARLAKPTTLAPVEISTLELMKLILNADEDFQGDVRLSAQRMDFGAGDRDAVAILQSFADKHLSEREIKQTLFQMLIGRENVHGIFALQIAYNARPDMSHLYLRRLLSSTVWWHFELANAHTEPDDQSDHTGLSISEIARQLTASPDFAAIVNMKPRTVSIQDLRSPGLYLTLSVQRAYARADKPKLSVDDMVDAMVSIMNSEFEPLSPVLQAAIQEFDDRFRDVQIGLMRNIAFHALWWVVQRASESYGRNHAN